MSQAYFLLPARAESCSHYEPKNHAAKAKKKILPDGLHFNAMLQEAMLVSPQAMRIQSSMRKEGVFFLVIISNEKCSSVATIFHIQKQKKLFFTTMVGCCPKHC